MERQTVRIRPIVTAMIKEVGFANFLGVVQEVYLLDDDMINAPVNDEEDDKIAAAFTVIIDTMRACGLVEPVELD